ncbi:hypothetical protein WR25_21731 [Diploscapter pachys]|uniref:PRORP domain-containing protein n=1 Tax=Diploscapter pachys TaxID=2018661 RepID=A0A2A2M0K3_9BILA|nr:hypothetical protein WR25_21731 [Diploscapter pachys]
MPDGDRALKNDRKICHSARDEYFKCFDAASDSGKDDKQAENECWKLLKAFRASCPATWVDHFTRKHNFERYRAKLRRYFCSATRSKDAPKFDKNQQSNQSNSDEASSSSTYQKKPVLQPQKRYVSMYEYKQERLERIKALGITMKPIIHNSRGLIPIPKNSYLSILPIETPEEEANLDLAKIEFNFIESRQSQFAFELMRYGLFRVAREFLGRESINWHSRMIVSATQVLRTARIADSKGEFIEKDVELAKLIKKQFKQVNFPEIAKMDFEVQLNIIADPVSSVSKYTSPEFLSVLRDLQMETVHLLCCAALDQKNWDAFKIASSTVRPHDCPQIFERLLAFTGTLKTPLKKGIINWYIDKLCEDENPIPLDIFENSTKWLLSTCGVRYEKLRMDEKLVLKAEKGKIVKVPDSVGIAPGQYNEVSTAFMKWIKKEAQNEGIFCSITKRRDKLLNEHGAVLLIGRIFLRYHLLDPIFKDPRIQTFYCDKRSDDDLLCMMAAMQLGPNARILTNDRFKKYYSIHEGDPNNPNSISLEDYTNKITIRFDKTKLVAEKHPKFDRIVQKLDNNAVLFSVFEENEYIPNYTYYLLKLER